jgi:ornithine cyclodeaminase
MRYIDGNEIDSILDPVFMADVLYDAFLSDIVIPDCCDHVIQRPEGDATLFLMPAWTSVSQKEAFVGAKIGSVFPMNGSKNLPAVMAAYLLMDGASGVPLAILDGARLTSWRTAAASALAARYLARKEATVLTMIGAGTMAPFLIRAHCAERPINRIFLWNHQPGRAESVAAALKREGIFVEVVLDREAAIRQADIISVATLTTTPLVEGAWLKCGAHVDGVGAFTSSMRETDDDVVRRATLFCDVKSSALKEAGDLFQPIYDGIIKAEDVKADLFDLARGTHSGRSNQHEITFFKSVGSAIEDLAAAIAVWKRAR